MGMYHRRLTQGRKTHEDRVEEMPGEMARRGTIEHAGKGIRLN